jgi:hypothetical protein
MYIDYHLFDVACDKVFGHFDWYCPVVHFRVVSFDWGDRGHDVVIGVRAEVCDASQAIGFAGCDVCSVFPLPHDFFLDELYWDRVLIFPRYEYARLA